MMDPREERRTLGWEEHKEFHTMSRDTEPKGSSSMLPQNLRVEGQRIGEDRGERANSPANQIDSSTSIKRRQETAAPRFDPSNEVRLPNPV